MRKFSTTRKALRVYAAYNPNYFPLLLLQTIFKNLSPYFNLWMSAEIVTLLYEASDRPTIYRMVLVTIFGNLFIHVMGAALTKSVNTQLEILNNNEAAAFNRKTLSLDYDKLENPDIRQHRRNIKENAYINNYGVVSMRLNIGWLFDCAINLVFALVLFAEMVSLIGAAGFQWLGVILLVLLVAMVALNIYFQSVHSGKTSVAWNEVGKLMLEENRLGRGYSRSGMDNRIYRQQLLMDKLNKKMEKRHREVFSKVHALSFQYSMPVVFFQRMSELVSYLIICFYCVLGTFPIGGVIKYVGYLSKVTASVGNLFYCFHEIGANEKFLQVYLDYFDIKNDMYQGSLAVEKRSDKQYDVEFKNVSFQYPGTEQFALKNINLNLKVGERLAVVGMNGSGKTTFIKLLCRLYDPTEGEIKMNDFNIRKYDYRQYLDIFSVVFQDYHLLAMPLGNNVASAENWDTEKAERLLEEVGFGERYADMPKKLETPLYKNFDEDGVNISGGEAQKIALARALYKDAPFIILDEPTAALDPIAEAEIYAKFDEIVGDKTAIYISHRLSSCRFCDKIAVFDKGEIVQVGTHEELLQNENGKYYELWNAQAQYYTT